MKNKDLQTLDMLRGEFEKSVDSAKVPLKLQKQSIVHMLEKDAQERKAQEEAEAKKKYQVVTVKKLIAIAAALIVTVTGTLVMQPGGQQVMKVGSGHQVKSDNHMGFHSSYEQVLENVKKNAPVISLNNDPVISTPVTAPSIGNPFNGQQPVTPEVTAPVIQPAENNQQTTSPVITEPAQNKPAEEKDEQPEIVYQEIPATASGNVLGASEELITNSSEGVARFEDFEADTVKQNGEYVYVLTTGTTANGEHTELIRVAKIVPGNQMEDISEITVSVSRTDRIEECVELIFHGNTLIVISKRANYNTEYDAYHDEDYTVAYFYDISDPANPVKRYKHVQDGEYVSVRLCGSKLYIVTSANISAVTSNTEAEDIIPVTEIFTDNEKRTLDLKAENIFCDTDNTSVASTAFTYVTVTDVSGGSDPVHFAFYGGGKDVSCHADTIVISRRFRSGTTGDVTGAETECTKIFRFNVTADGIGSADNVFVANGVIVGGIYVDEKKGSLRIVTKSDGGYNVCVFNEQMECVDAIDDILHEETVEQVKYIGNRVYLVYGENTSIIDFSKKLNAESIVTVPTAISTNLYEVTSSVLLGIGFAGEEKKAVLTLFDFSNPENFTSTDKYELPEGYTFAAGNDGRCVMVDSEKKIFGIPVIRTDAKTNNDVSSYLVFSVEGGKITLAGELVHDDAVVGDAAVRCICIDDTIYTVSGNKIVSHSANDCKPISVLEF